MKKIIQYFFIVLIISPTNILAAPKSEVLEGEYIVQRKAVTTVGPQQQSRNYGVVSESSFAELVRPRKPGQAMQSQILRKTTRAVDYDARVAKNDCEEIMKDPSIATCEPNYVRYQYDTFPNDPDFFNQNTAIFQWGLFSPFADGVSTFDIRAHRGWDISRGSNSVVIGILDSGINYQHPDLIPNIWRNPNETFGNNVDDDGNGYVDDIIGIDSFNRTNDPFDCNGHGSHVAGIIGAKGNNGIGITGVAWDVQLIMAKQAIDCGPSISTEAAIRGMEYFYNLKQKGVNIVAINASYGGPNGSATEKAMIERLALVNIVFVAAAGNDGINIDIDPRFPAAFNLDNMVTVANIDNFNAPTSINQSSNFGTGRVHIGAPGTEIYSTINPDPGFPATYGFKTGTSMAAPMVAGALAVLAAHKPHYKDYRQFKETLLRSAFKISAMGGKVSTGGMLYLYGLLTATDTPDACPSDPNKIAPGFCGCGVSDASGESDGDGVPDCADSCPSDPGKVTPGTCGCGVADADANQTGTLDCIDQQISAVSPRAPKLSKKKKSLVIAMAKRDGATYLVTITTKIKTKTKKGYKTKTTVKQVFSEGESISMKLPKAGSTVEVQYQYTIGGPSSFLSALSSKKKIKA